MKINNDDLGGCAMSDSLSAHWWRATEKRVFWVFAGLTDVFTPVVPAVMDDFGTLRVVKQ